MSRIFLAEDDEYVGRVFERAFRLKGHDIEIHPDGEDAARAIAAATSAPDAFVLDLMLPKVSGAELLRAIIEDPRFKTAPVIVMTNTDSEAARQQVLDAGADLYLLKVAHEPSLLVEKVENLIDKYRTGYTR